MDFNIFLFSKKNGSYFSLNSTLRSYDYTDFTKTYDEKIELEKRRRHQVYSLLDYVLSVLTYFDFFSQDAFLIIKRSKNLAQACRLKQLTSEFLLFPFLDPDLEFFKFLKEYNLDEQEITRLITSVNKLPNLSFSQKKNYFFYKVLNFSFLKQSLVTKDISYSYDVNTLFEKAAENALTRFKTPVITPEILFITMMESKTNKISKLIKRFFKNETSWYLLRYKLIKQIHLQEINVRTEVSKNEQYFAYLLKTHLSEFEFNRIIDSKLLSLGVSSFRNKLIGKMLKINIFDLLKEDIYKSVKVTGTRTYST